MAKSCPTAIKRLNWKRRRLSAPWGGTEHIYVPVGRKRAKEVLKSFGWNVRLPRPGMVTVLGDCDGYQFDLRNEGGKFRVRSSEERRR
jgi:hypothetical protein